LDLSVELRVEPDQDVDALRQRVRVEANFNRIADEAEARARPRVLDLAHLRLPFAGGGHRSRAGPRRLVARFVRHLRRLLLEAYRVRDRLPDALVARPA
jgi:hypothetical protein